MTGYGLEPDEAEADRLRRQAAGVHLLDADLWSSVGLVPGADVADLGCGPAAVMLDTTMIRVQPPSAPVSEPGVRFLDYQRAVGNDPAVGLRLSELLEDAGLEVDEFRGNTRIRRRTAGMRGPTWAARRAMVAAGVAAEEDLERWDREFALLDAQEVQPWIVGCLFVAVGRGPGEPGGAAHRYRSRRARASADPTGALIADHHGRVRRALGDSIPRRLSTFSLVRVIVGGCVYS